MIYRISASKDTTLDSGALDANSGQSEILYIGTVRKNEKVATTAPAATASIYRSIIKFGSPAVNYDLNEIATLISGGYISSSAILTSSLHLFHAYSNDYASTYDFKIKPVTELWDEGNGFSMEGNDQGTANWVYRNSSTTWAIAGGTTGAVPPALVFSTTHSVGDEDFNVDISPIVTGWIDITVANRGLLIEASSEDTDTGSRVKGVYSRHTNTIFSPYIDVCWDDRIRDDRKGLQNYSTDNKLYLYYRERGQDMNIPGLASGDNVLLVKFRQLPTESAASCSHASASWMQKGIYRTDAITVTSSVSGTVYDFWYSGSTPTLLATGTCSVQPRSLGFLVDDEYNPLVVSMPNLEDRYHNSDLNQIEVFARKKYPTYTYATSSITELQSEILYNASYSLYDYETQFQVIPPSKFTAVSYNGTKNWFDFRFTGLPVNRGLYFEILYNDRGIVHSERINKVFLIRDKD